MIKEKHEAGPQTKTLSIMTNLNSLDPVILVLIPVVLLFILFALAAFYTYKNIKTLEQNLNEYANQNEIALSSTLKDYNRLNSKVSTHESMLRTIDVNTTMIKHELFKPLYELNNIVDFAHKDYPKNLTGKIVKVNTFAGDYPDYTVEVEAGITYNIHQSQIVAWTN